MLFSQLGTVSQDVSMELNPATEPVLSETGSSSPQPADQRVVGQGALGQQALQQRGKKAKTPRSKVHYRCTCQICNVHTMPTSCVNRTIASQTVYCYSRSFHRKLSPKLRHTCIAYFRNLVMPACNCPSLLFCAIKMPSGILR